MICYSRRSGAGALSGPMSSGDHVRRAHGVAWAVRLMCSHLGLHRLTRSAIDDNSFGREAKVDDGVGQPRASFTISTMSQLFFCGTVRNLTVTAAGVTLGSASTAMTGYDRWH